MWGMMGNHRLAPGLGLLLVSSLREWTGAPGWRRPRQITVAGSHHPLGCDAHSRSGSRESHHPRREWPLGVKRSRALTGGDGPWCDPGDGSEMALRARGEAGQPPRAPPNLRSNSYGNRAPQRGRPLQVPAGRFPKQTTALAVSEDRPSPEERRQAVMLLKTVKIHWTPTTKCNKGVHDASEVKRQSSNRAGPRRNPDGKF